MLSYAAYIAAAASPSLLRTTQSPTSQNFHRLKPVQVRVRVYLHIHLGMSQAPLQLSPLCSAQFLDLIQGFPNFRLWRSSWRALIFAGAPYENFTFEGASNLSVFVDIFFFEHLLPSQHECSAEHSLGNLAVNSCGAGCQHVPLQRSFGLWVLRELSHTFTLVYVVMPLFLYWTFALQ